MDKLIFQSSFLLFVTSNNYNAWMTCSGISPLGHMYSKTTSIHDQGTQNLVPEKCSHNLCIGYLYCRDTFIQRKGTIIFLGSRNQGLTST